MNQSQIDLYQKTLRIILDNPNMWNQRNAYISRGDNCSCFIAIAASESGYTPEVHVNSVIGCNLLGITSLESQWLYNTNRTLEDFQTFGRILYGKLT